MTSICDAVCVGEGGDKHDALLRDLHQCASCVCECVCVCV